MKKFLAVTLSLILVAGLASCARQPEPREKAAPGPAQKAAPPPAPEFSEEKSVLIIVNEINTDTLDKNTFGEYLSARTIADDRPPFTIAGKKLVFLPDFVKAFKDKAGLENYNVTIKDLNDLSKARMVLVYNISYIGSVRFDIYTEYFISGSDSVNVELPAAAFGDKIMIDADAFPIRIIEDIRLLEGGLSVTRGRKGSVSLACGQIKKTVEPDKEMILFENTKDIRVERQREVSVSGPEEKGTEGTEKADEIVFIEDKDINIEYETVDYGVVTFSTILKIKNSGNIDISEAK